MQSSAVNIVTFDASLVSRPDEAGKAAGASGINMHMVPALSGALPIAEPFKPHGHVPLDHSPAKVHTAQTKTLFPNTDHGLTHDIARRSDKKPRREDGWPTGSSFDCAPTTSGVSTSTWNQPASAPSCWSMPVQPSCDRTAATHSQQQDPSPDRFHEGATRVRPEVDGDLCHFDIDLLLIASEMHDRWTTDPTPVQLPRQIIQDVTNDLMEDARQLQHYHSIRRPYRDMPLSLSMPLPMGTTNIISHTMPNSSMPITVKPTESANAVQFVKMPANRLPISIPAQSHQSSPAHHMHSLPHVHSAPVMHTSSHLLPHNTSMNRQSSISLATPRTRMPPPPSCCPTQLTSPWRLNLERCHQHTTVLRPSACEVMDSRCCDM